MRKAGKARREIISLKEEFVLREAFAQEIVRKQFISDVTGIPMDQIRSVTQASGFLRRSGRRQKQGILDFVMTMNNNTKIDVELQLRPQKFWVKRSLFYLSHLYVDEMFVGENYEKLKKCISISILDFNILKDREENHSVFTLKDAQGRELTDLFEIHVIELKKQLGENGPVDHWIRLFQAKTVEDLEALEKNTTQEQKSEGFRKAVETVKTMSLGSDLRWYFLQLQKAKRDRWAEDEYVRDEGRAEGLAEGMAEGRAEGLAEGMAEGRAEGMAEGSAHTLVKNVEVLKKNTGQSLEEVCRMLGTTVEEYEKAKKTAGD